MADRPFISFEQAQAAMKAMTEKATQSSATPVAMAIVDEAGHLVAYAGMDNMRLLGRRHALRKAYTSAITGDGFGCPRRATEEPGPHCLGHWRSEHNTGTGWDSSPLEGWRDYGWHRCRRIPQRPGRRGSGSSWPGSHESVNTLPAWPNPNKPGLVFIAPKGALRTTRIGRRFRSVRG